MQMHWYSQIHTSSMHKTMAFKTNKSNYKRFQRHNKLETTYLLNVQISLQIQNLPRQTKILHSRHPKTIKTIYSPLNNE